MESKASLEEIYQSSQQELSDSERALIEEAYNFAQNAHDGQKRNSGEPYFYHAVEVAKNCANLGADAVTIAGDRKSVV